MTDSKNFESLFSKALRIRLIEERIAEIYPSDKIESPVHLSIGQEHVSVGICEALQATDLVFGTYRGHALYLAKGGSLKKMMAELFGKVTGCGQGKAGSMHLSAPEVGMLGSSAIVASTIPHSVGAALAAKVRKTDQVIVCFFGEGATGEGIYHESLNFAAKQKLPVLFVCENNDLAIYSRVSELHSFHVVQHAEAYGIDSKFIEQGWDLNLIYDEACKAVNEIRKGHGPKLLEIKTFRVRQHVGPKEDYDIGYRSRTELDAWIKKDPLFARQDLASKYEVDIETEIEEAIRFAEESPFPTESHLYEDVY